MSDFQLIDPDDLARRIAEADAGEKWMLLEAHFSSIDHPLDSDQPTPDHIPGAIQVHPSYLESGTNQAKYYPNYEHPSDGNLLPAPELGLALNRLGITPNTLVVVYGTEPDGTMAAARLAWGLMVAGVGTVRLLDGGIDAWLAYGGDSVPVIATALEISRCSGNLYDEQPPWRPRLEYLATTAEVLEACRNTHRTSSKLVDVRKPGEWDGTLKHYYSFFSKAGHIPNAILQGDWDNLLDMKTHRLQPTLESVALRWREQGIIDAGVTDGSTTLIFYCGTGWRSSISFLVAQLLGLRAKNYDDGFYGWSWNDENEIVLGKVP